MKKVPKMISTKDLSYISDIFNWNITANKKIDYYLKNCKNKEVCSELKKISKIHKKNCELLVNSLGGNK